LPHDWSIEGPFDQNAPAGGGGGYLPGGIGWYRKRFKLPDQDQDKRAAIQFDGVYKNCDVWLNGHHLGFHPYEPGVLKAVGKRDGEVVREQEIVTAGAPARVKVIADRERIAADGRDVVHLTAQILDAEGHPVPTADDLITFDVQGPGRLIGVDNGNPISHEPFQANKRRAFNGLCLAIVQSTRAPGTLRVTASAPGLAADTVRVEAL
ncbi:MAG: sugar-binding domain-containing protein, partial [Anaerolineae bacterium]